MKGTRFRLATVLRLRFVDTVLEYSIKLGSGHSGYRQWYIAAIWEYLRSREASLAINAKGDDLYEYVSTFLVGGSQVGLVSPL